MRALIHTGEPRTLKIDNDHPEPTPSEHYTIRTRATALTREELTWPETLSQKTPVPGYDLSGVVLSTPTLPDGASTAANWKFKPGDEIYAMTTFVNKGNAREITEATEKELALKPKNLSWQEAATVPLSALSAWQALFDHCALEPVFNKDSNASASSTSTKNKGKRILITAASGSVGIWAVQLARLAGLEIVATCGPSNVKFVEGLGAHTVLDYTTVDLLQWVEEDRESRAFDIVLDCVGRKTLVDAWKCVRRNGRMVSVAEPADRKKPDQGVAEGVDSVWFIVKENPEQLAAIADLIERQECIAVVDSVYTLDQFEAAFERLEKGHARGKVVITL
ncbi:zinc-binding oxidoreductase [Aaosphaeria arxii CBS 175.79]|uniref:Zinc-binding oxidoreductase n=1 Tax=Aaosphaeria arxii CBS 175.79 TaxID=1450172 RepID=A0A6A5XZY1_9PLEO|nr:zinc-binding oxidoreductase [Aaosphaeria arxii CBS 175.79]KAF2018483.1 zinc-binding oxidoreductase [Aaosphaeria arxii CBS 175.79]